MANRAAKCALLAAIVVASSCAFADSAGPVSVPWSVIAGADVIVVGELENPVLDPKVDEGTADIRITKVLKGRVLKKILHFRYIWIRGFSDALPGIVGGLRGKPAMVFLAAGIVHPSNQMEFEMYSGDGVDALLADLPAEEQRVREELDREPVQASRSASSLMRLHGGIEDRVQASIANMANEHESRRDAGVDELLQLDCEGLPYLIKAMNDHRPFLGELRLPNAPGTFEAFAQYKPKELLEAISMILTWKTGFGRPDHGELGIDDGERQKIYDYWLIYLANHQNSWQNISQRPGTCL